MHWSTTSVKRVSMILVCECPVANMFVKLPFSPLTTRMNRILSGDVSKKSSSCFGVSPRLSVRTHLGISESLSKSVPWSLPQSLPRDDSMERFVSLSSNSSRRRTISEVCWWISYVVFAIRLKDHDDLINLFDSEWNVSVSNKRVLIGVSRSFRHRAYLTRRFPPTVHFSVNQWAIKYKMQISHKITQVPYAIQNPNRTSVTFLVYGNLKCRILGELEDRSLERIYETKRMNQSQQDYRVHSEQNYSLLKFIFYDQFLFFYWFHSKH